MDTERIKELSPCTDCPHWYKLTGKCIREEMSAECPKDVQQPRQYNALDYPEGYREWKFDMIQE